MRIITGATERSNISSMYEDLGWVCPSRRRLIHRLTLFYKITNTTLCTLKRLLKHFPPPVKHAWFSTGSRFLNIHHTRIRLGCSKLKSSLHFNLFVEDDPFCTCDRVIEDAYHYFSYVQIITIKPSALKLCVSNYWTKALVSPAG